MKPTVQQTAFLSQILAFNRNVLLRARAGCGKTTAIMMAVVEFAKSFPDLSVLICAFNKEIANEIRSRLNKQGLTDWKKYQGATVHSLGWGLLKFFFRLPLNAEPQPNKVRNLIYKLADATSTPGNVYEIYGGQIKDLVGFAKRAGVGCFPDVKEDDMEVWHNLASRYDVNGFNSSSDLERVIKAAQHVFKLSANNTHEIDYDDQIFLPLYYDIAVRFKKDLILVDEYQDISRARKELIKKFLSPRGIICAVGDDGQAIYGFTGAETEALDQFKDEFNAVELPLSVTWRCPKSVVKEANAYVVDLQAAEEGKEGTVLEQYGINLPSDSLEYPDLYKPTDIGLLDLQPNQDAILCRNTAPLITLAYKLIRAGKPAKVEGRKIGEGLKNLAKKWKLTTTDELADRLLDYRRDEVSKLLRDGEDSRAEAVEDKINTLLEIIDVLNLQDKHHINDVSKFIDSLFEDGANNVITLATYHRSKGREWQRVFLYEHSSRCPSPMARQEWARKQEDNLAYVAITRSMDTLVYVN